jgi:hypothetical protein
MSEEGATAIVEMQLALNQGRPFGGVRRTPEATTPTTLDEFLRDALPNALAPHPQASGSVAGRGGSS